MKRVATTAGYGVVGLVCLLAMLFVNIGGGAIHLWASWYAWQKFGIVGGFIALSTPFLAEIVMLFVVAGAVGTYWNFYTVAILVWIASCATLLGAAAISKGGE